MKEIKAKAILYAFGSDGVIVFSQILDIHKIRDSGIVRLVGILFDTDGNISQEFENTYDNETGALSECRDYAYREHLKLMNGGRN